MSDQTTEPKAPPADGDHERKPVPAWHLHRRLYDWVLHWADTPYGTPALGVLSFCESSFFPVPPDVLLIALAVSKPRRSFGYAFVCSAASVLGGFLGYLIGLALMEAVGIPLLETYGYLEQFRELSARLEAYQFWGVLLAALTPIPYKVFTIAAGSVHMDLLLFGLASVLGRSARFYAVAGLIRLFGPTVKRFIDRYFNLATFLFFVLLVLGFVVVKYLVKV